jgi:hypothetical protein
MSVIIIKGLDSYPSDHLNQPSRRDAEFIERLKDDFVKEFQQEWQQDDPRSAAVESALQAWRME